MRIYLKSLRGWVWQPSGDSAPPAPHEYPTEKEIVDAVFLSFIGAIDMKNFKLQRANRDGICRFIRSLGEDAFCTEELCGCLFGKGERLEWKDWSSCLQNQIAKGVLE
eukprot:m.154373 g.154373  ORF g.154373 m.154373 type:complete len:108 (+) comp38639_c0_seq4:218-541(+)